MHGPRTQKGEKVFMLAIVIFLVSAVAGVLTMSPGLLFIGIAGAVLTPIVTF